MRAIIFKYITTRPILTDSFVKSTFFSLSDCEGKEQNSNKSQTHPPVQFKIYEITFGNVSETGDYFENSLRTKSGQIVILLRSQIFLWFLSEV